MLNTKSKRIDEALVEAALEDYVGPVASTMGPGGKNVIVLGTTAGRFIDYRITQDGVSLTQAMRFNSSPEAMLVSHVCGEASDRTWRLAGDGTTSTLVILRQVYRAYRDMTDPEGEHHYTLREVRQLLDFLETFAVEHWPSLTERDWLDDEQDQAEMLRGLAFVATHGDGELVRVLVEAQQHIGRHGKVDIVASIDQRDYSVSADRAELGQGMRLKCTLPIRAFANSGSQQRPAWQTEVGAYVCLTSTPVQSADEASQVLIQYNELSKRGLLPGSRPLLIVAPVFSEQALAFLHKNVAEGFPVFPLMLKPAYEDYEVQDVLEDIENVSGARLFGTDRGLPLSQIKRTNGKPEANRVFGELTGAIKVTIDHTLIEFADREMPAVQTWVDTLMNRADAELTAAEASAGSTELRTILIERANRILGRTARIILHGGTSTDQQRRADLADDGARTLAAAMRSGVIPAQGLGLLKLYAHLRDYHQELSAGAGAGGLPPVVAEDLKGSQPGFTYDILECVRRNCLQQQELLEWEYTEAGAAHPATEASEASYHDYVLDDVVAGGALILDNDARYTAAATDHIYDGGDVPLIALRSALGAIRSLITTQYVVSVDSLGR